MRYLGHGSLASVRVDMSLFFISCCAASMSWKTLNKAWLVSHLGLAWLMLHLVEHSGMPNTPHQYNDGPVEGLGGEFRWRA